MTAQPQSGFQPRIIAFCCHNSLYGGEDPRRLGRPRLEGVKVVELPCSGKIDRLYMLKAFTAGYDAVAVVACPEGQCRLVNGTRWAERRVKFVNDMLAEIGIPGPRAFLVRGSTPSRPDFQELMQPVIEETRKLGPSPAART